MDPITLEAQHLRRRWLEFWNTAAAGAASASASASAPAPRALLLIADGEDRALCLQALRWIEWQPENRHPFVILEEPFHDEPSFVRTAAARLDEDLARLRSGLADDGVSLPALDPLPPPTSAASLRALLVAAAAAVSQVLDGLAVILAPPHVLDSRAYRRVVAELAQASDGTTLRVAAVQIEGADLSTLLTSSASFRAEDEALRQFLMACSKSRKQAEDLDGPESDGSALMRLLGQADLAMRDEDGRRAIERFQEVGQIFDRRSDPRPAGFWLALGGAQQIAGEGQAALASYQEAKALAIRDEEWLLAANAVMGEAELHFHAQRYGAARRCYEEAAALPAQEQALVDQAQRMIVACLQAERAQATSRVPQA